MSAAEVNDAYAQFLSRKQMVAQDAGRDADPSELHPSLWHFQRDMCLWALRKGRAAIWADCGLGKTRLQIEWLRLTGERGLIIAPLAVCRQTIREAANIGVEIVYARKPEDCGPLTICNYEMTERIRPEQFGAVVADESSVLKDYTTVTRNMLIETFRDTPWKLCCTATPAPNDNQELGNHAEFLGVMTRTEMLASFFVHDDSGWRMKGHARRGFYRWLASWGMSIKKPSDLGYDDAGFTLPPLKIEPVIVRCDAAPKDRLFFAGLKGVGDRAAMRKATVEARVAAAAELILADDQPWIAWAGLNDEANRLAKAIPGAVNVEGAQSPETKAELMQKFIDGRARVLVTKCSVAAWGLNLQHCARQVFVGLGDSYEQYYQAIRRCWRFGQKREVIAYIVLSEAEQEIHANVLRKEAEAERTSREMIREVAEFERNEMRGIRGRDNYAASIPMRLPVWM